MLLQVLLLLLLVMCNAWVDAGARCWMMMTSMCCSSNNSSRPHRWVQQNDVLCLRMHVPVFASHSHNFMMSKAIMNRACGGSTSSLYFVKWQCRRRLGVGSQQLLLLSISADLHLLALIVLLQRSNSNDIAC